MINKKKNLIYLLFNYILKYLSIDIYLKKVARNKIEKWEKNIFKCSMFKKIKNTSVL